MISNLLQPKQYDKHAVGSTIIWMFDQVYTRHLLSWSAFARSALFTICMTVIFLYESFPGKENSILYNILQSPNSDLARVAIYSFAASIITNIISAMCRCLQFGDCSFWEATDLCLHSG